MTKWYWSTFKSGGLLPLIGRFSHLPLFVMENKAPFSYVPLSKIWPVIHVKIWLWVLEAEIFLECIGQVLLGLGVGGNTLVPTWAWSADGGTFWPLLTACIFPAWTDGRQWRGRRRVWVPCTAGPISGTLVKVSPFPGSFSNHKWPQQDQWLVVNVLITRCSQKQTSSPLHHFYPWRRNVSIQHRFRPILPKRLRWECSEVHISMNAFSMVRYQRPNVHMEK